MKQPPSAKQVALRALETVKLFGDRVQRDEAEFLCLVIERAKPEPVAEAVNFATETKAQEASRP